MSATRNNPRNQRNSPYVLDGLAVSVHHSAAGVAWRWRTELTLLAAFTAALWRLTLLITLFWAIGAIGGLALALMAVPPARRFITRRFWCLLVRHRLHRLCYEARLHTRSGRIPLVLWIRPTKVGERAHLLCRAGICAEDFDAHIGELRAACYAREARVTRNRRWSQLVTIDIIRRDTLAASNQVSSPLQRLTALYQIDIPGSKPNPATTTRPTTTKTARTPPRPPDHTPRAAPGPLRGLPPSPPEGGHHDDHHHPADLREFGYSWAEIGTRLGITRQAAQQRWGGPS